MLSNSQETQLLKNSTNNIGEIIGEGLKNPVVRHICMHEKNKNSEEIKRIQSEFSRFVGYCILFKSSQDVEKYMVLTNKDEQIEFIKYKIAERLGISKGEIELKRREVIQYAYQNFKKNGYVFHAANSASVEKKMLNGLSDGITNIDQQKELLHIESIYRKYEPNNPYSPLGHAATDIEDNKTGWFFDGLPIHSTVYANSPQWFSYLCGKSYIYFDSIPEERRTGYANRDYETALEAVIWLIKSKKMSLEDRKEILSFFIKSWKEYKDTKPCLMFIPVEEVGINDDVKLDQYLDDEGMKLLFDDIISGKVNPGKNYCCKKTISPEKLSYVDLSPILPRFRIERNKSKENNFIDRQKPSKIQEEEEER